MTLRDPSDAEREMSPHDWVLVVVAPCSVIAARRSVSLGVLPDLPQSSEQVRSETVMCAACKLVVAAGVDFACLCPGEAP